MIDGCLSLCAPFFSLGSLWMELIYFDQPVPNSWFLIPFILLFPVLKS